MHLSSPVERISPTQARRIALAAQGFAERRPPAPACRHVGRVLDRLGLVQIDSVNVLARAHYVPLFSRLGPYDPALLEAAAYHPKRRALFEYWGHEASLLRLDLQPLMRWRMERAERGEGIYGGLARFAAERRPFVEAVLREVEARGPLAARDLGEGGRGSGSWWGWSDGKRALEFLFWAGRLTTATRRGGFERVYDLPERVLPPEILDAPTPDAAEAQRALIRHAASALGIATEPDLRDYFRLGPADAKARVAELVESGDLVPVTVAGWTVPAYLDPAARRPRRIDARALISPFDPLVWERARTERLFGFRYRIEIYTPAHKREHGYYCLPFLLGDRIAARVDLKAERGERRLRVNTVHIEPGTDEALVRAALADELAAMAAWLGLERISGCGFDRLRPDDAAAGPRPEPRALTPKEGPQPHRRYGMPNTQNQTAKEHAKQVRRAKDMQQAGLTEDECTPEEVQRKVDEASEESFPASDPPAFTVTTKNSA